MTSIKELVLSHEDLLHILYYNSDTGIFTWQVDFTDKIKAGDRAGSVLGHGYRRVRINKIDYLEHCLVFFYMMGRWPVDQLDHINGIKDDNRWSNLREATNLQNNRNISKHANNTSGYKGVTLVKSGKYIAQIRLGDRRKHLGYFDTAKEASAAYEEASKKYFGEFHPDKLKLIGGSDV